MLYDGGALNESDWKKRSAEETVSFLNDNLGPDDCDCDRIALVACMMSIAVYQNRPNDALFWSVVCARRVRLPLSEKTRRELQALLDDSKDWNA